MSDQQGWGSGASPLLAGAGGTSELEATLAEFEDTEAAIVFPTGYAANLATARRRAAMPCTPTR